jgi:hypothetical protein
MPKSVELCQLVARAISHTTWNIPRIRDGDRWRNIENPHLVENPSRINGHDHYEDAIFRARESCRSGDGKRRLPIPRNSAMSIWCTSIIG